MAELASRVPKTAFGPRLTAIGNDCGYDQIFVQQLMNFGGPGDLVIAISGSGNSPNVLAAVDWAKAHAAEYGLDPDRIALMGGSYGGGMALDTAFDRFKLRGGSSPNAAAR